MYALTFSRFGGTEVLAYRQLPDMTASPGCLLVSVSAAGLNFADIYRRQGRYSLAGTAPHIGGYEGAGEVIAVGEGVTEWRAGDRVGFADVPFAHASQLQVPVSHAIRLPKNLSDVQAAAILLQGLTADYLVNDLVTIKPGDKVAVLAAAGGVGRLLTGLLVARQARVYAVASTRAKRDIALNLGASQVLAYQDWAVQLHREGGVAVVFDSLGSTLDHSLSALSPAGRVVLFGMAGGEIPPLSPASLLADSKGVIGGDLWTYLSSRQQRQQRADRLFSALATGQISLPPLSPFSLADGAAAHQLLESRDFSGKVLLLP
ncbi:zinc-binding dehydrogenase [Biostraticola tofi]|uniref:NADPH2:quinone reductase n=1 Tax=Biostraticola tofi TaxID=466109 RepID=A0A4V6P455_9GAMM|nr:zinc-binding dehydrogenase [Biostraticola tofi]TCV95179.1 NADPH2:quinone reductase [Biostraticola tofi]